VARRHLSGAMTALLVAVTLVATGVAGGCGARDDSGAPEGGAAAGLNGTHWRLAGWSVSSLDPAQFTITADFADGHIGGTSAVNSYGGPYAAGSDGSFSVGELAQTQMAGPEPAMRAESAYMTLLGDAASYTIGDGTLVLYDANGNQSLIFTTAPEPKAPGSAAGPAPSRGSRPSGGRLPGSRRPRA
jgi:heat shock protein HslJ